jgi:uncharacterized protein YecE (DUF72 family)
VEGGIAERHMKEEATAHPDPFQFRHLHPLVFMGTASDRYAGWIGQIYSEDRFRHRISRRPKTVGGKAFTEETLPVESVEEYFRHFSVLELDFTFYSLLLDKDLKPTQTFHVLQGYQKHLREGDRLILKVPQVIFAQKLWRKNGFIENPDYLNAEVFTRRFYEPALDLLGQRVSAFVFEQEYQAKKERTPHAVYATALGAFLSQIPRDHRYHTEVRTESLLSVPYFEVLREFGVGQVLSHWTWLPPLDTQFKKAGRRFFNSGRQCVIRLMTPLRMRYEEAYAKAFPFNRLVDGMMNPEMVQETSEIMLTAIDQDVGTNIVINNRAGGNAPLIAQKVSERFRELISRRTGQ